VPQVVGDGTWLTVGEAAQRLGVSDTTVRSYIEAGRLTATRLPSGHRRVLADSVETMRREIYGEPG
jgi:excisionase family DNA binding protein